MPHHIWERYLLRCLPNNTICTKGCCYEKTAQRLHERVTAMDDRSPVYTFHIEGIPRKGLGRRAIKLAPRHRSKLLPAVVILELTNPPDTVQHDREFGLAYNPAKQSPWSCLTQVGARGQLPVTTPG
jgi:hypothetical protein